MGKFQTIYKILNGGGLYKNENKLLLDIFDNELHNEIEGGKLSQEEKDRRENIKFKKYMNKIINKNLKENKKKEEKEKKVNLKRIIKEKKESKKRIIKENSIRKKNNKISLRKEGLRNKKITTYIKPTEEEIVDIKKEIQIHLKELKKSDDIQEITIHTNKIKNLQLLIDRGFPIRGVNKISYYNKYVNLYNFFKGKEILENLENTDYFNDQYILPEKSRSLKYYQTNFIKNWSLSEQKVCILYYGVGTGKTRIIVNCAQQFTIDHPDRKIYFVLPASLILNTIGEFLSLNINPKKYITNDKGELTDELQYNFISYQQLLLSDFDFEEHSLLIIDEVHNLRNIFTKDVFIKVNARKYERKDKLEGGNNVNLIGNKLATKLIESNTNFLRCIFLTGTLFVNSEKDIEAIVSIGYQKLPLIEKNIDDYNRMINDIPSFKNYYNGLFSKYVVSEDPNEFSNFPKINYELVPIIDNSVKLSLRNAEEEELDSYFGKSRNQGLKAKNEYIINFLKNRLNEKTCIYTQFIHEGINDLQKYLKHENIKYEFVTGEDDARSKMKIIQSFINGEFNVLFFTLAIKEGISFKEVNNVIIYQPYWNYSIMEQIIARAVRTNSHVKKNKATVNVKFLLALTNTNYNEHKNWFTEYNNLLNNDIKKFIFKETITETKITVKNHIQTDTIISKDKGIFNNDLYSRDDNIMNRMLIKQEEINTFEKKLVDNNIQPFEKANDIDNNDFIKLIENEMSNMVEKLNRPLNIIEQRKLKKELHMAFYKKENIDTLGIFTKFENVILNKGNKDLTQSKSQVKFSYDNFKKYMTNKNKSNFDLTDFFKTFEIDNRELRDFQAYFTPVIECKKLIEYSGILKDNRNSLSILEPTAGIGNIISSLLAKNDNSGTYKIDCNELHSIFFSIGQVLISNLNIKWHNLNFYNYNSRTNYDYILGNPPFNVKFKSLIVKEVSASMNKETGEIYPGYLRKTEIDVHWYDIHFVAKSYNLLNIGGVLCMIMSNRFLRDKTSHFQIFLSQLESLNENYPLYIQQLDDLKTEYIVNKIPSLKLKIDELEFILSKTIDNKFFTYNIVPNFVKDREDKGFITKEQEVIFDMVLIRLVKIKDFSIDFTKSRILKLKTALDLEFNDDKNDIEVIEDKENKIKNIRFTIDKNGKATPIGDVNKRNLISENIPSNIETLGINKKKQKGVIDI